MISENRLAIICHRQLYQKRMAKTHERKVQLREFREGDLVLRNILSLPNKDIASGNQIMKTFIW
jgi:hypothetical protein